MFKEKSIETGKLTAVRQDSYEDELHCISKLSCKEKPLKSLSLTQECPSHDQR